MKRDGNQNEWKAIYTFKWKRNMIFTGWTLFCSGIRLIITKQIHNRKFRVWEQGQINRWDEESKDRQLMILKKEKQR